MKKINTSGLLVLSASLLMGTGMYQSSNATESDDTKAKVTDTEQKTEQHPGEKVYKTSCMVCHVSEGRPSIAPPVFAVKNHVLAEYPERDEFIERVVGWVKAPNADGALMPGAIRKFGLMPAITLNDADLQAVAEYLYDTDMNLPDWYKEHYEAEHGTQPNQ